MNNTHTQSRNHVVTLNLLLLEIAFKKVHLKISGITLQAPGYNSPL